MNHKLTVKTNAFGPVVDGIRQSEISQYNQLLTIF